MAKTFTDCYGRSHQLHKDAKGMYYNIRDKNGNTRKIRVKRMSHKRDKLKKKTSTGRTRYSDCRGRFALKRKKSSRKLKRVGLSARKSRSRRSRK